MLYFSIIPDLNNEGEYLINKVSTDAKLLIEPILFTKDSLNILDTVINGNEITDLNYVDVYSGIIYELLDSNGEINNFYDLQGLLTYMQQYSVYAIEINTLVYKEGNLISKTNTTSKSLHEIFNV
jgi:hypothetical protein